MLVQVKWINDRYDFVEDFMLCVWLDAEAIAEFRAALGGLGSARTRCGPILTIVNTMVVKDG